MLSMQSAHHGQLGRSTEGQNCSACLITLKLYIRKKEYVTLGGKQLKLQAFCTEGTYFYSEIVQLNYVFPFLHVKFKEVCF